jgi:membrane protein DedA with SNARE-associated domain
MGDTLSQVNEYLDFLFAYGPFWVYLVIFSACFVENLFPPFPGDSFIVVAGGLIALQRLDPIVVYLLVNFGGIASVMVMYYLGLKYGRDYFLRKDFKYFSAADILGVEKKLARWGAGVLMVSRFVVGFRSALAVAAGIGRYPAGKMFLFSLLSYFAFTGMLMYIGFVLVDNLGLIEQYFDQYNRIIWPLLILAAVAFVVHRYLKLRSSRKPDK